MSEINAAFFVSSAKKLTSITVSPSSTSFSSVDGVLYSADKSELVIYPRGKTDVEFAIPDFVGTVGSAAFAENPFLRKITFENENTGISGGAFANCVSLADISLPQNLKGINQFVFSGCTSLKTITLPDSITGICGDTFANCTALEAITLSKTLDTILLGAFSGCCSLERITLPEENNTFCIYQNALCKKDMSRIVKLPAKSSTESFVIPATVTGIDDEAFMGCTALKRVIIESGASSEMTNNYFTDCTNLEEIHIPSSFEQLNGCFDNCPRLVIYTAENSAADRCAKENGIATKIITETTALPETDAADYNGNRWIEILSTDILTGMCGDSVPMVEGIISEDNKCYGSFDNFTYFRLPTGLTSDEQSLMNAESNWQRIGIGEKTGNFTVIDAYSQYCKTGKNFEFTERLTEQEANWVCRRLCLDGTAVLNGTISSDMGDNAFMQNTLTFTPDADSLVKAGIPIMKPLSLCGNDFGGNGTDTFELILGNANIDFMKYTDSNKQLNCRAAVTVDMLDLQFTAFTGAYRFGRNTAKLVSITFEN